MLKKITSILVLLCILIELIPTIFFTTYAADNSQPVIFFSDMTSAPNSGWSDAEPNKGASITVWGKNFGDTRLNNYITVNGVDLLDDSDYETWGEIWPTDEYQKITFFLNNTVPNGAGEIAVTMNGKISNSVDFTVRAGNIYFVTADGDSGDGSILNPYDDIQAGGGSGYMRNATPGDVYYYRGGTYTEETNGGNALLWLRSETDASGTEGMPISMIAYPGESPVFSIPVYSIGLYSGVSFDNNYMVFSGFTIDSEYKNASLGGDYHRFVGNKLTGLKNYYNSGTGLLTVGSASMNSGNGTMVLGNDLSGGNSQNRFDHGIYVAGCADTEGNYIGWNHLYNNNFGRGAQIVVNHQQERCTGDQVLKSHYVFNNTITCDAQRGNAIGIFDLSYDEGEIEPEPTYVYNNISNGCGTYQGGDDLYHIGYGQVFSHSNGHAKFYNNTAYNSGYRAATFKSTYLLSTDFRNNIIHLNPNFPGPSGNIYVDHNGAEDKVTLSNNLFYGADAYVECADCANDSDNLYIEPDFVDAANGDFSLQEGSPLIGAGYSELPELLSWAPLTKDMNLVSRGSSFDMGALQYQAGAEIVIPEVPEVIEDVKAPILSNELPAGTFGTGTTQTTLEVITDEQSTCKYDTQSSLSYTDKSNTFLVTGTNIHETSITGLEDGNAYTYYVECSDESGNISTESIIIFNVDEKIIQITDQIAPIISNPLPAGEQVVDTININIRLETNENSTCKYDILNGKDYVSKDNIFSTTGTMSHSENISGLTNGNNYSYYVQCLDESGNISIEDTITFNIAEEVIEEPVIETPIIKTKSNSGGGGSSNSKKRRNITKNLLKINNDKEKLFIYNEVYKNSSKAYTDKERFISVLKNDLISNTVGDTKVYQLKNAKKQEALNKITKTLLDKNYSESYKANIIANMNSITINIALISNNEILNSEKIIVKTQLKKNMSMLRNDYIIAAKEYNVGKKMQFISQSKTIVQTKRLVKDKEYYARQKELILANFKRK